MAIEVNDKLQNSFSLNNALNRYFYLYEPVEVRVSENDGSAPKIYMDLITTNLSNQDIITYPKYLEYDLDSNVGFVDVDLMKIARQFIDTNFYRIGSIYDIRDNIQETVLTNNKYRFRFYSDATAASDSTTVGTAIVVGGRRFLDLVNSGYIDPTDFIYNGGDKKVSEMDIHGVTPRHKGIKHIDFNLLEPSSAPPLATTAIIIDTSETLTGNEPMSCGNLVWKSRYGGWCSWGFDLVNKKSTMKYGGSMEVGMYESNGVRPYVPVNYTDISESYTITLKGLHLSKNELKVLDGLNASPAIYYQEPNSTSLELMRLSSASVPLDSMADGGDATITLSNISNTTIKTI